MKNQRLGSGQYAIVERNGKVFYFQGKIYELETLNDLQELHKRSKSPLIFVIPFRVIREKGYEAKGNELILVLKTLKELVFTRSEFLKIVERITKKQKNDIELEEQIKSNISDKEFAQMVERIKRDEIADGNASQVILSRKFRGKIKNMTPEVYLILYSRLLQLRGQYMTFLFSDENKNGFIGASPECHLQIQGDRVIMNPIAGTLLKKTFDFSSFRDDLINFLKDQKEIIELCQILDEELKMMMEICPKGGRVVGPSLRETGKVIHTEYQLTGEGGSNNAMQVLKITFHAPTLVGSPLESAARIINKYEPESRGYYGGQYGIYYSNRDLDSAIFIRTAYLWNDGRFRVQAGAGIVEDSDPIKEAKETTAKAGGFLQIFREQTSKSQNYLKTINPNEIKKLLKERNVCLSSFHLRKQSMAQKMEGLRGVKITIINNEDNFAYVLGHMVTHMGCQVEIEDTFEFDLFKNESDIVVLGPGPGNINDLENKRMVRLLEITRLLTENKRPLLGVCLGHQAILKTMGVEIVKQPKPTQGVQLEVELFGKKEFVGFYNSFTAYLFQDMRLNCKITTDENKRIIIIQSPTTIGCLFHPESVMTQNGYKILQRFLFLLNEGKKGNDKLL